MQIMDGAHPFSVDGSRVGVLLSHGFTGTTSSMMPLAHACERAGYTVRVPRLPGHGTTWQELNTTSWQDWSAHVERVAEELLGRCDVVVVVGLSMGGTLATHLAEKYDQIDGLFLINPAFVMKDPRLLALPFIAPFVKSIPAIGGDINVASEPEIAYERTPLKALLSQTKMWKQVTKELPRVTQPVVLCHSPQDHVVPPACSELFLKRVGSLDVRDVVLEQSYHVATLDADAPLIEAELIAFIDRLAHQS